MQVPAAPACLAAALLLAWVAAGAVPAAAQDFSITNTVEPATAGRRDVMRQLQAWWDVHAYYPRHASNNDEDGTVRLHLVILPDGRIWAVTIGNGSGSSSLDRAALATFQGGFVRPLPPGAPELTLDLPVHYLLAHRHGEPAAATDTPLAARRPFTIANDPVKSPILDTMLQRTCTGTVVRQGIRNHPEYGTRSWAQAVFFRRPDGSPWVKFYEGGFSSLSPVTEIGKVVQWTGREERLSKGTTAFSPPSQFFRYTAWPDGEDRLSGSMATDVANDPDNINHGGTVDLVCATDIVPPVSWSAWSVTPGQQPPGDPP